MTSWRRALAASGLIVLSAGCAPKQGSAPAAPAPDRTITAADLPHPKAGYWERTETANGGPPHTSRFCQSGAPVKIGDVGKGCSTFTYKRTFLGAVVVDAACGEGPISATLRIAITGDFNSRYVTDAQMSLTLQGHPTQRFTTHAEARYLGPDCPPAESGTN
jgi:hypothetical protein